MAKRRSFWDDPKYDYVLKKLAAQELYTSEIAAKMTSLFGFTITRNSIVSRASRTGVELSQPTKIERFRSERSVALRKWLENPENRAYRDKCRAEGLARWMKTKSKTG